MMQQSEEEIRKSRRERSTKVYTEEEIDNASEYELNRMICEKQLLVIGSDAIQNRQPDVRVYDYSDRNYFQDTTMAHQLLDACGIESNNQGGALYNAGNGNWIHLDNDEDDTVGNSAGLKIYLKHYISVPEDLAVYDGSTGHAECKECGDFPKLSRRRALYVLSCCNQSVESYAHHFASRQWNITNTSPKYPINSNTIKQRDNYEIGRSIK